MAEKRVEKNINFDEQVNRVNTDSLKFDFAARRGMPENVLPLWVADMDFKTSSIVLDELSKRLEHGIFGYTDTKERYAEAVAGWLGENHGLEVKEEWIVKTPGIVFALAMAVKAYTDEGDAVLIQQPVYYPFTEVIRDNNRRVISNDLVQDIDGKYHIDFEDFENKITAHKIKLFIFCSPHNPVGRVWTIDELKELARICIKHEVIVVSDEIHSDFTYEGYTHTPLINVDEELRDYCITATSPGKTFNLAGLQISNIIIQNPKLRRTLRKEIDAAGYSQLNTMGIIACEVAYRYGNEWYVELKKYLQKNLEYARKFIKTHIPEIKLVEPEGTYLIWLDFRPLGLCEKDLEDLIVNKAKLWLDSGAIFGKTGAGFQRINIATNRATLEEALKRIKSAINSIKNS